MNTVKQIAEHKFPTRDEILSAMNQKLGASHTLFAPIVQTMAEVTEMIMLRYWREAPEKVEEPEKVVEIVKHGTMRKNHYCSHCQYQSVYPRHKFCPNCGTKIKWIDNALKAIKGNDRPRYLKQNLK